jgi:RNA recognition motif-containing protein
LFKSIADAQKAIETMNGYTLRGRSLIVSAANPFLPHPQLEAYSSEHEVAHINAQRHHEVSMISDPRSLYPESIARHSELRPLTSEPISMISDTRSLHAERRVPLLPYSIGLPGSAPSSPSPRLTTQPPILETTSRLRNSYVDVNERSSFPRVLHQTNTSFSNEQLLRSSSTSSLEAMRQRAEGHAPKINTNRTLQHVSTTSKTSVKEQPRNNSLYLSSTSLQYQQGTLIPLGLPAVYVNTANSSSIFDQRLSMSQSSSHSSSGTSINVSNTSTKDFDIEDPMP